MGTAGPTGVGDDEIVEAGALGAVGVERLVPLPHATVPSATAQLVHCLSRCQERDGIMKHSLLPA